jgi:hypothetical protein
MSDNFCKKEVEWILTDSDDTKYLLHLRLLCVNTLSSGINKKKDTTLRQHDLLPCSGEKMNWLLLTKVRQRRSYY